MERVYGRHGDVTWKLLSLKRIQRRSRKKSGSTAVNERHTQCGRFKDSRFRPFAYVPTSLCRTRHRSLVPFVTLQYAILADLFVGRFLRYEHTRDAYTTRGGHSLFPLCDSAGSGTFDREPRSLANLLIRKGSGYKVRLRHNEERLMRLTSFIGRRSSRGRRRRPSLALDSNGFSALLRRNLLNRYLRRNYLCD